MPGLIQFSREKLLSFDEEYKLSPWAKWRHVGVFPFSVLFHIILIVTSTMMVVTHNQVNGVTHRTIGQDFGFVFFPEEWTSFNGDDTDNPQNRYFIFTLDEFNASSQLLMNRFWSLPEISLTPVDIASGETDLPFPHIEVTKFTHNTSDLFDPSIHFPLERETFTVLQTSPESIFPGSDFDEAGLKDFMSQVITLTYVLPIQVHDPNPDSSTIIARACYEWSARITFDFSPRQHIEVLWSYIAQQRCIYPSPHFYSRTAVPITEGSNLYPAPSNYNPWIALYCISFLIAYFLHESLLLNYILFWLKLFLSIWSSQSSSRSKSRGSSASDALIKFSDIMDLRDNWSILSSVGGIFCLAYAIALAASGFDPTVGAVNSNLKITLGFGCAFLWLSIMRYLDVNPRLYSTILTLQVSLPRIARFLVGAIPLFISFGLFALVALSNHAVRYGDGTMSYMTLFAFINGDALVETFSHTEGRSSPISSSIARRAKYGMDENDYWWSGVSRGDWAYGFSYYSIVGDLMLTFITFLFMYVVINCCVALVEEAFFNTRSTNAVAQLEAIKEERLHLKRKLLALSLVR